MRFLKRILGIKGPEWHRSQSSQSPDSTPPMTKEELEKRFGLEDSTPSKITWGPTLNMPTKKGNVGSISNGRPFINRWLDVLDDASIAWMCENDAPLAGVLKPFLTGQVSRNFFRNEAQYFFNPSTNYMLLNSVLGADHKIERPQATGTCGQDISISITTPNNKRVTMTSVYPDGYGAVWFLYPQNTPECPTTNNDANEFVKVLVERLDAIPLKDFTHARDRKAIPVIRPSKNTS